MTKFSSNALLRAKEEFYLRGESVAEWARRHNFPLNAVYHVLNGHSLAKRGHSHRIAVALGLKPDATANAFPAQSEDAM